MHLDLDQAVARAGLAPAAFDIEAEPARPVAARLGVRSLGKQVADVVKYAGISRRVGARRAPDGRLVDVDDLVQIGQAGDRIVRARTRLGAVQLGRKALIQDLVDERGLARAGHAGHAGERAQRDGEIRVLEVVDRAALDGQLFAVALPSDIRHRDALAPGQVLSSDRLLTFQQILHLALEYHLAPVAARARADIHDVVGCQHGVLVVLDHDQGVAQVAQAFQGGQQLVVVALVQADGRLVQDIQHAHERRADLGRQTDALALAAGQRARRARQGQVFQADRLQKAQPVLDLLDHAVADLVLHLGQLQGVQKLHRLDDRLFRKLRDVQPADRDREHLGAQAAAVARGTRDLAHALLDLGARVVARGLLVAALEVHDNALKRLAHHAARHAADRQLERFFRTVQQLVHRRVGKLLDRGVQRKAVLFAERIVVHGRNRARVGVAPAGRADRALLDGQLGVGDDALRVDALLHAEAGAHRARAVRVVERKHARGQLFDRDAAVVACIVLRERDRLAADHVRDDQAARQRGRGLDRIRDAAAGVRADDHAVDHDLDVVLLGLFELDLFAQVAHLAVHTHADIALLARVLEHLGVLALFAADDRRENLHARLFLQRHQPVDNLVDGLLMDLLAALGAVRRADVRPEQAQVVIDLGDRADRRTRVLRGGFLIDRDGGRQAVDVVHIRLVHLPQKLPRIAGQRLDIAALALGIDRVEREGRFARTGQAGQHDQLVTRDLDIYIFQVVLTRTLYMDKFLHVHLSLFQICSIYFYKFIIVLSRCPPRGRKSARRASRAAPRRRAARCSGRCNSGCPSARAAPLPPGYFHPARFCPWRG